jgi:hypothetical protein
VSSPQQSSFASSWVDEHGQSKQLSLDQHSTTTKNTTVLSQYHKHTRIIQQNHGDELKLKIKPRRRRTSNQQQVQEEKDKPSRAEPGGEGQARSKPSPPASSSS